MRKYKRGLHHVGLSIGLCKEDPKIKRKTLHNEDLSRELAHSHAQLGNLAQDSYFLTRESPKLSQNLHKISQVECWIASFRIGA